MLQSQRIDKLIKKRNKMYIHFFYYTLLYYYYYYTLLYFFYYIYRILLDDVSHQLSLITFDRYNMM